MEQDREGTEPGPAAVADLVAGERGAVAPLLPAEARAAVAVEAAVADRVVAWAAEAAAWAAVPPEAAWAEALQAVARALAGRDAARDKVAHKAVRDVPQACPERPWAAKPHRHKEICK